MNNKRWKLLLLSLIMMLGLAGCSQGEKPSDEEAQKQFDEFIQGDFIDTMESDYLTMHIYLEHPENYNVNSSNMTVQIGDKFDENDLIEDQTELKEIREAFDQFNRDQLSDEQKDTYDCYILLPSPSFLSQNFIPTNSVFPVLRRSNAFDWMTYKRKKMLKKKKNH